MPAARRFRVHGRVVDAGTNRSIPGLYARACDQDPLRDDLLGTAVTDARGDFSIFFTEWEFKEIFEGPPELYVVIYSEDWREILRTKPSRLARDVNAVEEQL